MASAVKINARSDYSRRVPSRARGADWCTLSRTFALLFCPFLFYSLDVSLSRWSPRAAWVCQYDILFFLPPLLFLSFSPFRTVWNPPSSTGFSDSVRATHIFIITLSTSFYLVWISLFSERVQRHRNASDSMFWMWMTHRNRFHSLISNYIYVYTMYKINPEPGYLFLVHAKLNY